MSDQPPPRQPWPASSGVSGALPDLNKELDVAEFDTVKLALPDIASMVAQQREEEAKRHEALARFYHALTDDLAWFKQQLLDRYQDSALQLQVFDFINDTEATLRSEWGRAKRLALLHEQAARQLRGEVSDGA